MATLRDFSYTRYSTPQEGVLGEARFKIRGQSTPGGDNDFVAALEAFKRAVPLRLRVFDGQWRVQVTPQVRAALVRIFENAESLFSEAEMQPALPGL